ETVTYIVIKSIKNRQYRYEQRSVRFPGRRTPKTISKYLGPVGSSGGGDPMGAENVRRRKEQERELAFAMADLERDGKKTEAWQREHCGGTPEVREAKARQEHLDKLHEDFGLKLNQEEAPKEEGA